MSPPILSEYKRVFAGKRICQNFFGGARLLFVPFPFVLLQILLFILPPCLLLAVEVSTDFPNVHFKVMTLGISLLLLEAILILLVVLLKRGRNLVSPRCPSIETTLFAQEDSIHYQGLLSPTTWHFVAPNVSLNLSHFLAVIWSTVSVTLATPLLFDEMAVVGLRLAAIFVLSCSRFSAVISAPPEIATFDTNQRKTVLYRPFYTGIIGLAYFLQTGILSVDTNANTYLGILAFLPVGWGLGFLPPLDSLFPWLIELVLAELGGSPSYFYFGSTIGLILVLLYNALVFIVGSHGTVGITLQCIFGYLILLDTSSLLSLTSKTTLSFKLRGKQRLIIHLGTFVISLMVVLLIAILQTQEMALLGLLLGVTITGVTVLHLTEMRLSRKPDLSNILIWTHFVLQKILTLIIHVWLTLELVEGGVQQGSSPVRSLHHLTAIACNIRAYAVGIMHPKGSAIDMALAGILRMATSATAFPNEYQFTALIFLVSFGRRAGVRFCNHLISIVRITFADFASPLLDNKVTFAGLCILSLPLSACSLVLGSILEMSTLTPLFTLPMFVLGFPRPASFSKGKWLRRKPKREVGISSLDEAVYAAIGPSLATEFIRRAINSGISVHTRDAFVARHEDRLVFLRILGYGLNFVYVGVKGLELQEQTSCHHQEAAWMDENFEKFANRRECAYFGKKNLKAKLTVVTPLLEVKVPSYSESKSTIPSLSLQREKEVLEQFFFKSFSYLWIKGKPAFQGEAYWSGKEKFYGSEKIENMDRKSNGEDEHDERKESFGSSSPNYKTIWPPPNVAIINRGNNRNKVDWATAWIKKCVGETIPSNAIRERIEKLVNKIWKLVHNNTNFEEIKLHAYFEEAFLLAEGLKLKTLEMDNIVEITKKSFRYAAKLALDEIYQMGLTEETIGSTEDDTFDELSRYEQEFIFCSSTEIPGFIHRPQGTKKTIVSMMRKEDGMSQMRIFTYDGTGLRFNIGRIDKGVLEGIWSNLSLELLYLTSDDDERFSIQNDRYLMRNLLTECADSPLGYPVYEAIFRLDLFKNFRIEAL